jgi:hypothetical protein
MGFWNRCNTQNSHDRNSSRSRSTITDLPEAIRSATSTSDGPMQVISKPCAARRRASGHPSARPGTAMEQVGGGQWADGGPVSYRMRLFGDLPTHFGPVVPCFRPTESRPITLAQGSRERTRKPGGPRSLPSSCEAGQQPMNVGAAEEHV